MPNQKLRNQACWLTLVDHSLINNTKLTQLMTNIRQNAQLILIYANSFSNTTIADPNFSYMLWNIETNSVSVNCFGVSITYSNTQTVYITRPTFCSQLHQNSFALWIPTVIDSEKATRVISSKKCLARRRYSFYENLHKCHTGYMTAMKLAAISQNITLMSHNELDSDQSGENIILHK